MSEWKYGEVYAHIVDGKTRIVLMTICPSSSIYKDSPDCLVIGGEGSYPVGTISQWSQVRAGGSWVRLDNDELETP